MATQRASQPSPLSRITAAVSTLVSRLKAALFESYRPERHYMRGAGPKARALEQSSKQA